MNQIRGEQVLVMIGESIGSIESEAERLCLLLAECRREKYWKLRNFKSEKEWILATFTERSLRTVRQLARLGIAYEDEPDIIADIGVAKADAIKSLHPRTAWVERSRNMTSLELMEFIKNSISRVRTVMAARNRISLLIKKEHRLEQSLQVVREEISQLQTAWKDKRVSDDVDFVSSVTVRRWKKIGALA